MSRGHAVANSGPGLSFPGGNVTYARHLVKKLIPDAITGERDVRRRAERPVNWPRSIVAAQATRIRVGATVVARRARGAPTAVTVASSTPRRRLYRVRARRVAMATGGWVTKRVLADLPATFATRTRTFQYAPALIVNVALTNWRFMHRLGITAARWFDDRRSRLRRATSGGR